MSAAMNLDKQIKRHVIGPRHTFFALTLPGFETICEKELALLTDTLKVARTTRGGVVFEGRLTDLYAANLHLRTAGRILMRIGRFKATHFHQLHQKTKALRWSLWLPPGAIPVCKISAHKSRLFHSKAIAQRIRQAIYDHWMDADVPPGGAMGQTVFVRLKHDRVTLSLDSSGDHLYQRGYKRHAGRAPLRETTAAIILKYAGYQPHLPLIDPMCGTGTFSLEGALMAKQVAPGLQRHFAFMQWPAFKPRQWHHMKQTAAQTIQSLHQPLIMASDADRNACAALRACLAAHQLEDAVRVVQKDFFKVRPPTHSDQRGLVAINPPYGRRLAPMAHGNDAQRFYLQIMDRLSKTFHGWRVALLVPWGIMDTKIQWPLTRRKLYHGGLAICLMTGKIQ